MSSQPTQPGAHPEGRATGELLPVNDMHTQMVASLGTQIQTGNFHLLVGNLIDDSSSIETYHNTNAVIRGANEHLENLRTASGNILVMTRFLTAGILHNYCPPKDAALLNRENYRPIHGTPLFQQGTTFLKDEVLPKAEAMRKSGKNVATFNTIFSDGEDTQPGLYKIDDARRVIEEMFATGKHIVAATGVEGGVDLYKVFRAMGIPERWIQVIARRDEDIVRGFSSMSDRTLSSSVSEADFTHTSETGFGPRGKRKK